MEAIRSALTNATVVVGLGDVGARILRDRRAVHHRQVVGRGRVHSETLFHGTCRSQTRRVDARIQSDDQGEGEKP